MRTTTTMTCGQALVRLLHNYGVDTVFGIPGVHTLELYRGLPGSGIRHILARHEQGAGFMADGYARVTGKPGVCFVISGPGVTNVATAIGQAYSDSIPLLVISSINQTASLGKGRGFLHESTDQRAITAPITAFSAVALHPEDLPDLLARAFTVFASERPRPVHIAVPLDVLAATVARDWTTETLHCAVAPGIPLPSLLKQAVENLRTAQRPMLIVGGGALDAAAAVQSVSGRLGAVVFTTVAGKGVMPAESPLNAGASLCVAPGWEMIASADVVLAIGTELAEPDFWRERLPLNGTLIRVDIDPHKFNDGYRCDIALHGDARATLEAMLELLPAIPPAINDSLASAVARLRLNIRSAHPPLQRIHQAILDRVGESLPANAFVSVDMTQLGYTANYMLMMHSPRSWLHPTGFGTLGYALPAAIGAKLARPDRPGLVIVGDGGFLYTVQELATAAEEVRTPLVILLWNNDTLGQIRDDMLQVDITPVGVTPRNPDFAALGAAFGCAVRQPACLAGLGRDLDASFRHQGVTLIEMKHAAALA